MNALGRSRVALETTLLVHGVPRDASLGLMRDLASIIREEGAEPALIGVFEGQPRADLTETDLEAMLALESCPKANTANLGPLLAQGATAATTVSTTLEIASRAGIEIFATGGLGGVHPGLERRLDISADLVALTKHPVAVVCSGVKSVLDVASSRELLETLGVPVVGFQTGEFPAFYLRGDPGGPVDLDARFDDVESLGGFVRQELDRCPRGIVIANPIPVEAALDPETFAEFLGEATSRAEAHGARGRDVTPAILEALHEISGGATLRANVALVKSNAQLAAKVAVALD